MGEKEKTMTDTELIQELGRMLTSTTVNDTRRLHTIVGQLDTLIAGVEVSCDWCQLRHREDGACGCENSVCSAFVDCREGERRGADRRQRIARRTKDRRTP